MELPLTGGCQCGKIHYEITEAPQLVYTCHCTDCQRITGSAFSLGIALPETAFHRTAGEPRALQRVPDSGRPNTRFVCPECACWVYSLPRGGVSKAILVGHFRMRYCPHRRLPRWELGKVRPLPMRKARRNGRG